MNQTLCNAMAGSSRLANNPKLSVVLAYEDYVTGIDAVRTLSRLAERTGLPHEFGTHNVWKFEILSAPTLRNIAADEAANADMVIISAHGPGHLPVAVMHWIELWLGLRGTSPAALVALLDGASGEARQPLPLETYLKRCARRAGMDFFVQKVGKRQALDNYDFEVMAERAATTSEALEYILRSPPNSRTEVGARQDCFRETVAEGATTSLGSGFGSPLVALRKMPKRNEPSTQF